MSWQLYKFSGYLAYYELTYNKSWAETRINTLFTLFIIYLHGIFFKSNIQVLVGGADCRETIIV